MICVILLQYTEILRIGFFDVLFLFVGVILTLCLLQLSKFSIVDLVVQNVNLIGIMFLVLYVTFFTYFFNNISFLIKVVMFVPFVATSYLSLNSKLFVIWNYVTVMSIYCIALPFMAIQSNEVFVYIVLICSLLFMYKYLGKLISFLVIVCFVTVYNVMFLGVFSVFWCFMLSLDVIFTTEFVVASCFTSLILYVWVFGIYWYVSIKYFKKSLIRICADFETKSKLGVYFFVISVCLFSLSIKCLYVFNVLVYYLFDVLGVIKWNYGTKNPHHFFSCCKRWSSTISGRKTCVEYTSCRFYKQSVAFIDNENKRVSSTTVVENLNNIRKFYISKRENTNKLDIEKLLKDLTFSQAAHPKCVIMDEDGQCQLHVMTHSPYIENLGITTIPLPSDFNDIVNPFVLNKEGKPVQVFTPSRIVPVGYGLGSFLSEKDKLALFDKLNLTLPEGELTENNTVGDVHLFLLNEKLKEIHNILKTPEKLTYVDLLLYQKIYNEHLHLLKEAQAFYEKQKKVAEFIEWINTKNKNKNEK